MTISEARRKLATDAQELSRIESLLLSYPDVRPEEHDEIARYLRHAPIMDMGLLSTNEQAWAQAEKFRAENASVFRASNKEYALWAGFLALVIVIVVELWDVAI